MIFVLFAWFNFTIVQWALFFLPPGEGLRSQFAAE
jgi:hypothetical protein